MSNFSPTQPSQSQHGNITQWTHLEEMKWSSSGMLDDLAANNLGFGLAVAEICQTFGQRQCPRGHDMSKFSPTQQS